MKFTVWATRSVHVSQEVEASSTAEAWEIALRNKAQFKEHNVVGYKWAGSFDDKNPLSPT